MNRLGSSPSAYLRSAAHQPVHWYAWGDDAFAAAREADRPILLDIGAVWCHWCHVMDGESYEDPSLAEFLNQNFVCIKVDRDERPDVDARYQRAVQAFTGQGGWPLTAFLTPEGETFYGGTYFPPDGKLGRPGFRTVLDQVARVYHEKRDQVTAQAGAIRRLLAESLDESGSGDPGETMLAEAVSAMERVFDFVHGGFGNAPKFPHPAAVELLLRRWLDRREAVVKDMIELKLLAMARGGIHDHLGGGFHRYSTDPRWIVPHFEKMSYDNSELLRAYLHGFSVFGREEYRSAARDTVDWVMEVLADAAGGYGGSQDADVGLEDDGDYFTWTYGEAAEVLSGAELEVAAAYYDIGTAGEMHHNPGKNVLYIAQPLDMIAVQLRQPLEAVSGLLRAAHGKLRAARMARPAPFIDRTRYTNWNGMMAAALIDAGDTLGDPAARDHALRTLQRIRDESGDSDSLPHAPGVETRLLDDQVQVASAALDAWESTGDRSWLEWSSRIMDRTWTDFWDPAEGGLFDTVAGAGSHGYLPTRAKPVQDAPTPSPNGVAGIVFARLYAHTLESRWAERREALVRAFAGKAGDMSLHGATYLVAVDWQLHPAAHLVVTGPPGDPEAERMHRRALATFLPRRVVQRLTPADRERPLPPDLAAMLARGPDVAGYACIGTACRLPAESDREWSETLAGMAAP